jgi:hypothetical protein
MVADTLRLAGMKVKSFGRAERHDAAIILWTGRPTSEQRMLTEADASS